jgi:hypothetical protein
MVHVTSSQRSHGVEAEDGRVDAMGWAASNYSTITLQFSLY